MGKQHSWTRQQYQMVHRDMRRGFSFEVIYEGTGATLEIVKAADYSYQARRYEWSGWISQCREDRFKRFAPSRDDYYGRIPF